MEPKDWNIVLPGQWNRAILTPNWIATHLFELAPGTPVDIMVPLDGFGPFQIRHGTTVVPASGQLLVQSETANAEALQTALDVAVKAVEALPRTPLSACGVNIRYRSEEPPQQYIEQTRCQTETLFSNNNYELRTRRRGESLVFHDGLVNVQADIPTEGSFTVLFNFDRQTSDISSITAWLQRPASEYVDEAEKLLNIISTSGV